MAPVAISIAQSMGVTIDPFLMAVATGASSAFLTPIGHQSNTLVKGSGGYPSGTTGAWDCRSKLRPWRCR
jgi:di/tricarboxylate transporter